MYVVVYLYNSTCKPGPWPNAGSSITDLDTNALQGEFLFAKLLFTILWNRKSHEDFVIIIYFVIISLPIMKVCLSSKSVYTLQMFAIYVTRTERSREVKYSAEDPSLARKHLSSCSWSYISKWSATPDKWPTRQTTACSFRYLGSGREWFVVVVKVTMRGCGSDSTGPQCGNKVQTL